VEVRLVPELALAVVAGFLGGLIARRVGLPVILGYLFAGIAIGPFTPGPVAESGALSGLAEIGVAFLMFALGTELSRSELRELGRTAIVAGTAQILLVLLIGPLVAPLLGLTLAQGIFLGALLSLSSTVVALKLLMARGEAQSLHGRGALAILVAQDLAVVPMVILLPTLGGAGSEGYVAVAQRIGLAVALIAVAYGVGTRLVPWLLGHAAGPHARELFLVGVVALALGTAVATSLLGLSPAFGAFVAGLVLAGSEYRTQVLAEVLPLRDLFISLFFVSIGTLVDPAAVLARPLELAVLLAVVLVAKPLIAAAALAGAGAHARVALLAGAAVGQMGEFSFVLARIGVDARVLPTSLFDLVLAAAVVSIVLAPVVMRAPAAAFPVLERVPVIGRSFAPPLDVGEGATGLRRHVVICGYGRVARELADALERRRFQHIVISYEPAEVRELRARGIRAIYGDAANPQVLEHAGLDAAILLAVLVPDRATAEAVTRFARAHGPRLDIVARAEAAEDVAKLREAGATEVVQPEFEAGLEVIRHALGRLGVSGTELQNIAAGRRGSFYGRNE
jgi:CPA2 family monovalent cation:H+ antiporter-2